MQPPCQTHSPEWLVITRVTIAAFFLVGASAVSAQCAPGIPSAGNPGCIPPNQQNSPYYQGQASAEAPALEQPRVVWADRWGSIAMDDNGAAGTVVDQTTELAARKESLARCEENGGKKCETVLSYHNHCAAVAQMPSGGPVFASRAPTQAEAESNSVSNCGKRAAVLSTAVAACLSGPTSNLLAASSRVRRSPNLRVRNLTDSPASYSASSWIDAAPSTQRS
jgi:hypothetical protein